MLKWLEIQNTEQEWQKQALFRVEKVWPNSSEFENWVVCDMFLPHALKVSEYGCTEEEDTQGMAALLQHQLGNFELSQVRYEIACPRFLLSLDLYTKIPGKENAFALANLNNLGMVYAMQGHYDKPEQI